MRDNRRRHSAGFKAKVALEAIKQEKTISRLSSEYGVHANMITSWKRRVLEELPSIFLRKKKAGEKASQKLKEELYQQIGQLKVELDWIKKKSEQLR